MEGIFLFSIIAFFSVKKKNFDIKYHILYNNTIRIQVKALVLRISDFTWVLALEKEACYIQYMSLLLFQYYSTVS